MSSPSRQPSDQRRRFLVTQALPYANGDIHLGHLVEAVQTDVFVRYQKLRGHEAIFAGADDTHGTPIELSALKQGITPQQLIDAMWRRHVDDYARFGIGFDIFYSTNSPENREYAERIYAALQKDGLIARKKIEQLFCANCQRFLPDRFVTGTCPKCGAAKQYGDSCDLCGATYEPLEIKDPACVICGNAPAPRGSEHLYVVLSKREAFLREYILGDNGVLQEDMKNFVRTWIDQGLKDWCISRDGPYFGFPIPGETNKFFYVWLDAPIGYISSTKKWCTDHGRDVEEFWGPDADAQVIHFIGKDIVYFHTLFWPVNLHSAGIKLPTKIFVHGFLTVNGEKMSKSRGTFVLARDFLDKCKHPAAAQYLRFYFAGKLASGVGDLDLNVDEFCTRINTTLANNIGNLHHRTFVFCDKYFDGRIPDADWDPAIAAEVEAAASDIARFYETVEHKSAIERIHALGNLGNKYYQDSKPWELVKTDKQAAARVMVTCANLVRALGVFLSPVVPDIVAELQRQFGLSFAWDDHRFSLRNHKLAATAVLIKQIEKAEVEAAFTPPEGGPKTGTAAAAPQAPLKPEITFDQFGTVDLRVATITAAERVKKSNKLIKLQVDIGGNARQIVAGIGQHYEPEKLVGRQVVVVANLKPARLMGERSEGMLLAAQDGKGLVVVSPETAVASGARVA